MSKEMVKIAALSQLMPMLEDPQK